MLRLHRLIDGAFLRMSGTRLASIERRAQLAQGKGWGAATVEAEVAAVCHLLGPAAEQPLVVLDVGANLGSWTLEALRRLPQATIHAFEPSSAAFARLSSSVGDDRRVHLHPFALGASDSEATLFSDAPGSGIASLTKRRLDHFDRSMTLEERVPVRTLASWLTESGVSRVDVLKLDVEGHELDVLRAAGDRLQDVSVIQFEFGGCNIDTRTFWQDFWYLLTGAGFRLLRLGPSGLAALERYDESDEHFSTTNFFAYRATRDQPQFPV